ncbi:MBL fold metallo-hydrolase [Solirubrobacter taibaiensis]|nr:MBL fold metallo-hydrolase [Solirubrobacter taibaiensis]
MRVRRLTWAGLEVQTPTTTAVVDLLTGTPSLSAVAGPPREPLLAPLTAPGTVDVAAVTHLHSDHFDVEALRTALALGAPVLCPPAAAPAVTEAGFNARGVELWETAKVGELDFTAVPAVDGFGSPQVSWVISDGAARLIHCGDTLWHGFWWQIAERCGPFDIAFLPINGAIAEFDYAQPASGMPAVLVPEQAAAAADVLQAGRAAPIHYGTFHQAPGYLGLPDPESAFAHAAGRRGVTAQLLQPGEELDLSRVPS